MTYDGANEITEERFELLRFRYQTGLQTQIRGIDFFLFLILLIWCIKSFTKKVLNALVHILIL